MPPQQTFGARARRARLRAIRAALATLVALGVAVATAPAPASAQIISRPGGLGLVSAVLPSGRSVQLTTPGVFFATTFATAFATIINPGATTAVSCRITPRTSVPATFSFQATDAATNALVGAPNAPVNIFPGTAQTFVVTLTPVAPFDPVEVEFGFLCDNAEAAVVPGINTLLLSASPLPIPDIIALAATPTNDGIANIAGVGGTASFAVATVNIGGAGTIAASVDTGPASLPVEITICQTSPQTGACLAAPVTGRVATPVAGGGTPTFAIFLQGRGPIAFNPGANRIFVRFRDEAGVVRSSTSVAVRTQ